MLAIYRYRLAANIDADTDISYFIAIDIWD